MNFYRSIHQILTGGAMWLGVNFTFINKVICLIESESNLSGGSSVNTVMGLDVQCYLYSVAWFHLILACDSDEQPNPCKWWWHKIQSYIDRNVSHRQGNDVSLRICAHKWYENTFIRTHVNYEIQIGRFQSAIVTNNTHRNARTHTHAQDQK